MVMNTVLETLLINNVPERLQAENSEKSADQKRAWTEPHYAIAEDVG